jgi:hypothetical protein
VSEAPTARTEGKAKPMSGGALTPEFVMDLESRMRRVANNEYQRLIAKMWSGSIVKEVPSQSRRELVHWLLDTARIENTEEGNIEFEELVDQTHEYEVEFASKGLKVLKSKFEDLAYGINGGEGIQLASEWTRMITAQATYWPQEKACTALKAGASAIGYDGVAFFAANHPVNPFDSAAGTYKNLWTDSTSTGGSLGVKIDDRHSLETAFESFAEVRAAIAKIPMPNGAQPRMLTPVQFIAPPRMIERLALLQGAKFIGSDGSTDVTAVQQIWGMKPPIEAPELSAAFGGLDTDCYLVTAELTSDALGGLVYVNREPFAIRYYSGDAGGSTGLDAVLNRARELEWHVQGRNVMAYGHPYLIHKLVGQAA